MTVRKIVLVLAAACGAIGIALGAFGAHALRDALEPSAPATWQTAVTYLFWHVLAALLAATTDVADRRYANAAAVAFLVGIVLFSGSLFALALGAPRFIGAITPIGGVAWLVAWTVLAIAFMRTDR